MFPAFTGSKSITWDSLRNLKLLELFVTVRVICIIRENFKSRCADYLGLSIKLSVVDMERTFIIPLAQIFRLGLYPSIFANLNTNQDVQQLLKSFLWNLNLL